MKDLTENQPHASRHPQQDVGSTLDLTPTPSGRFLGPRWHCVATNYGQQFLAEHSLSEDGWRVYFPLHQDNARRIGPLFPGYGFVEFSESDDWPRVCRARGVYRLLGDVGKPRPLPVGVIEDLINRTSARRIVDDPGQDAGVSYTLAVGATGKVIDGPLAGWEGICTRSAVGRVWLLLGLFATPREVEFRQELVVGA